MISTLELNIWPNFVKLPKYSSPQRNRDLTLVQPCELENVSLRNFKGLNLSTQFLKIPSKFHKLSK
jgi:hypothetical protein